MNTILAFLVAAGMALVGGQAVEPAYEEPAQSQLAPPAAVEPAARTEPEIYTVVEGDNLSVIAERYGVDVTTLLAANPNAGGIIYPGDQLVVLPQKGIVYTVQSGDTLWQIARDYGVPLEAVMQANKKEGDFLAVGEKLFIPGARPDEPVSRGSPVRFSWPVEGDLTSPFGYRWGRLHSGIDIAADYGAPVRAAQSGRVEFAGWRGGYGQALILRHGQGYSTLYAHLSDYFVSAGQYVTRGQAIGYVGTTGNSTGPHLHFEVLREGQPVNPLAYLP